MSEPLHIGLELSLPCSSRVLVGVSFRMITTIMSRGKVVTYRILQARHMSLDSDLSGHNRLPTSTRSHPCRRWYVNLLRPVGFIFLIWMKMQLHGESRFQSRGTWRPRPASTANCLLIFAIRSARAASSARYIKHQAEGHCVTSFSMCLP